MSGGGWAGLPGAPHPGPTSLLPAQSPPSRLGYTPPSLDLIGTPFQESGGWFLLTSRGLKTPLAGLYRVACQPHLALLRPHPALGPPSTPTPPVSRAGHGLLLQPLLHLLPMPGLRPTSSGPPARRTWFPSSPTARALPRGLPAEHSGNACWVRGPTE